MTKCKTNDQADPAALPTPGPAFTLMALDAWKRDFGQSDAPFAANVGLRKGYVLDEVKAEGEGESRRLRFVISTETVDRDRDTIAVDGWRLDDFRRNPVVLWAHSYRDLPVARAIDVGIQDGRLVSLAEFPTAEVHPFGDLVYRLLRAGYLNATSVGFRPIKWLYNQERGGIDFSEQELLEYSIVPVPANAEALIEARSAGIDLEPLKTWAERVLDEWHGEAGIWVPRSNVERALELLDGAKTISLPPQPDDPPATKGEPTDGETADATLHVEVDASAIDAAAAKLLDAAGRLEAALVRLEAAGPGPAVPSASRGSTPNGAAAGDDHVVTLTESEPDDLLGLEIDGISESDLRALVRDAVGAALTPVTGRVV